MDSAVHDHDRLNIGSLTVYPVVAPSSWEPSTVRVKFDDPQLPRTVEFGVICLGTELAVAAVLLAETSTFALAVTATEDRTPAAFVRISNPCDFATAASKPMAFMGTVVTEMV